MSEVDQHVELVDSPFCPVSRHAQPPDGGQFAGIGTHRGTVRPINGSGQTGDAASLLHRLDIRSCPCARRRPSLQYVA